MQQEKRLIRAHEDGTKEYFCIVDEKTHAIKTEWDTDMLDSLKTRCAIIADEADAKADGMRQERIIPDFVQQRAFNEGWFNDPAKWKEWANSPEGVAFGIPYNGKVNRL